MTHSLMSSTAAVRIALQEIAVAEAEAVLCVLRAKKQLAQARLDASLAHDSYLTPAETLPASTLSSPSSASSLTTDSDSHSASPASDDFLLPPPFISSSVKRSRAIDTWTTAPDATNNSPDSSRSDGAAPSRVKKKQRRSHALLVSAKGTRVKVPSSQRYHWLYEGHCVGDRSRPVSHCLKLPPAYFSALDDLAALDNPPRSLRPVTEDWQTHQPEVVQHVTSVLCTHSHKVSCALADTGQQRVKGRKQTAPRAADDELSSADSEMGAASVQSNRASEDRGSHKLGVATPKLESSDWEDDYKADNARPVSERWDAATRSRRPVTDPRSLMTDDLYVEIVKVLLDPAARLEEIRQQQPALAAQMRRLLLHRHRFQLFWAHVYLVPDTNPTAPAISRLIPVLCHVDGKCKVERPQWSQCKRAVPLSQVAVLLDKIHSGGAHLRDNYSTLLQDYKNVPRKAVLYFASVCHGCKKVSDRVRNRKPPRAIVVENVRQRYVLDLIDLQGWQRTSTGRGKGLRYVAHMVDHSSKRRWARGLAQKTAALVVAFVRDIFDLFGHAALLHTDNGTEFANRDLEHECRQWGTYCVHGRPYHPESQGAIERPNGTLQRAMQGYHINHRDVTDWVDILQEVMRLQNEQVHTVTRLSPQAHFQHHDTYSREKKALSSDERVVLTVAEVEQMEKLSWVSRCSVTAYCENDEAIASNRPEVESFPVQSQRTVNYSESSVPSREPASSSAPTSPAIIVPLNTARLSSHAGPLITLDPDAANSVHLGRIHCLPRGELGRFTDSGWDLSLGACVSEHLRPRGTLSQGDCGPDSASMCVLGGTASPSEAVAMRVEVLQYMLSKEGRATYAFCQENEKEQPGRALDEVIEEGRAARDWVGHDWFTCFGSMLDLNVFVLSKLIRREEPVEVTYGIRLVTNAGAFIESDSANTVAVYYQGELPRGQERAPGHWESVWDKHGEHMWRHDHPTVQHCLLIAAQAMKITRRQQVSKMLMAAQNRSNNANEVIREGDIVWLSVPEQVIAAVKQQLRKAMEQQYTDRKMLVKVWKVTQVVSHFGRGVTEHFTILTQDGILEDTYPIDELERCSAPPSTHPIVALNAALASRLSKRVALVTAYKAYCRWDAAHSSIAQKNKKSRTLGVSKKRIAQLNTRGAGPSETAPSTTVNASQPLSAQPLELLDEALIPSAEAARSCSGQLDHLTVASNDHDDDGAVDIPCCLCHIPLTADRSRSCMLNSCLRPFCAMNASCTRSVRVDELLVYCGMQCAQKDGRQLPSRHPLGSSFSQPVASLLPTTAAVPKPSFAWSSFTYTCNTCRLPITHDIKTWCNTCLKYVHKKTRSQPWCTRAGWSRGGTTAVDGLVSCIECRFARDEEWQCFAKAAG